MSIPPLVCSTPPPPDQCEDDKDPEDFDIHYNLSQEDDYDYGSFSTYNHFQSAISVNKPLSDHLSINNVNNDDSSGTVKDTSGMETLQCTNTTIEQKLNNEQEQKNRLQLHIDSEIGIESKEIHEEEIKTEDSSSYEDLHTDKKNNEEDLNIEDLNLTVEEDCLNAIVKNELYNADSDKSDHSDKEKSSHIPDVTSIITSDLSETLPVGQITISPPSIDDIEDPPNSKDDLKIDDDNGTDYTDIKNEPGPDPSFEMSDLVETVQVTETFPEVLNEVPKETDDEFGDFNDFHTNDAKPSTIASVVDACDNPWGNNETDSDFGAFEAHFDDTANNEPQLCENSKSVEKSAPDSSSGHENDDDDDEFGDFDDFKSSAQETVNEDIQEPVSRVPVLDFQKSESESQLLENISKILNTIFEEDIPEPDSVFDGKLEAMLCETWGHLLETDVRQPYIVNWNSSIGQKTLLKALCIDSRNILFGAKWSYNMPKYAANLSAAPLQPQKQTTSSGQNQTETSSDKHPTKTPGTWSDPFTSDGQESCNKESNAVEPKRPTDLDVFDTVLSSNSDKIYSSTLGVQPIRQISLPDTHIFTPTDSETPRSKTIHYNGPSFLSKSSIETDKNPTEEKTSETSSDTKVLDDSDYSDFQDFKGSYQIDALEVKPTVLATNSVAAPSDASQVPSTSASYSIGILQPIKIEPIMPTLNWPSPGEVKETFDDFTEFASATTWNSDAQETRTPSMDPVTPQIDDAGIINNSTKRNEESPNKINDSFDDDFDTFQSAVPSNGPTQIAPPISDFSNFVASDCSQTISTPVTSQSEPELDFVFPKIDVKSEPILPNPFTKTNDVFKNSEPFMHQNDSAISAPKLKEVIVKAPVPPPSAVLQPTGPPQTQHNTAQILQPLSLESFSQINWPNPGINLQDLSRFNPVETLNSLKSDLSVSGNSKGASPLHGHKTSVQNQPPEDDIWGEFVSSKPKPQQSLPKKTATFADDDEWTDFVSSPTVKPQNGLNTISLNVHTNLNIQKSSKLTKRNNQALEIPITHYITPKSSNHSSYNDRHFQNL